MKTFHIPLLLLCMSCTAGGPTSHDALTPTMGWSSWNTFAHGVSDSLIRSQADAMVTTGLRDAGYLYINTDDGYFGGRDSLDGHLLIQKEKFPLGLRPMVDYIHCQGLKAGIYTDAGINTCGAIWAGNTDGENCGLLGHDEQDLRLFFQDLNFDFLKVDYCGGYVGQRTGDILSAQDRYTTISQALYAVADDAVRMNVCTGAFPGAWAAGVAGSWRVGADISCSWASIKRILRESFYLSAFSSPGHFNDMDMLEVGRTLTPDEDRTHFGMWCIMNSPLLIGCDLRTLSDETLALLSNPELIALNQDTLCQQAYVAGQSGDCWMLVRDVVRRQGDSRAVAICNLGDSATQYTLRFADVDLGGKTTVRDLFQRTDLGSCRDSLTVDIPAHGTRIFLLRGGQRRMRTLYEAEAALNPSYQTMANYLSVHSGRYTYDTACSGGLKADWLGQNPDNRLVWKDVHVPRSGRYEVSFRVLTPDVRTMLVAANGTPPDTLTVTDTGSWTTVALPVALHKGFNTLTLSNPTDWLPDVDCMTIQAIHP